MKLIRAKMNQKLNKNLEKIMKESAENAAREFAPHIQQLKLKHNSEISNLKTTHIREIEKIKQGRFDENKRVLSSLREKFMQQTFLLTEQMDKENSVTLSRFRKKAERDILRYESDLDIINRTTNQEIERIKALSQRDAERERNRYLRQIDQYKSDVSMANKQAEIKMQTANQKQSENDFIESGLPVAELQIRLDERNRNLIKRRKDQLAEEEKKLKEELEDNYSYIVKQREDEVAAKINRLYEDLQFLKAEESRMSEMLNRHVMQRRRAEKRMSGFKEELDRLRTSNSELKDFLFRITSTPVNLNVNVITNACTDEINKLKQKLQDILLEEMSGQNDFDSVVKLMSDRHEKSLKRTTERVKEVIAQKDSAITDLTKKLKQANEAVQTLTNALKF